MRLLLFMLIIILGTKITAAPLVVRAGEHNDFTRVVVNIPRGANWEFDRRESGYLLQLPVSDGYDTTNFFSLIPKDRISGVSQDPSKGELRLETDCDCQATVSLFRDNYLVIDISSEAPAIVSPFERMVDEETEQEVSRVLKTERPYFISADSLLPLVFSSAEVQVPDNLSSVAAIDPKDISIGSPMDRTDRVKVSETDALAALEQTVTENLGRALTQGLLDPELDQSAMGDDEGLNLSATDVVVPGVHAATSFDLGSMIQTTPTSVTQTGEKCLPSSFFDVATWGDDRSFSSQISQARSQLTGEFDEVEEQAALSLARLYIYFGFGREAIKALELHNGQPPERQYLTAIAKIIDDELIERKTFTRQISCPTPVALWAMFANDVGESDAQIDRTAVLLAFKDLPEGLQALLGPRLARQFIATGDNDAASQALAVVRTNPTSKTEASIVEIELDRALGESDGTSAELAEIASGDPRATPELIIQVINEAILDDRKITADEFAMVESLRFENSRQPIARDLSIAEVRGLIHARRFEDAEAFLQARMALIGETEIAELFDELAKSAIVNMSDAIFLDFSFSKLPAPISPAATTAMAQRVFDLGFSQRAYELLENTDVVTLDGQLLFAEIALSFDKPDEALLLLTNLEAERADELRMIALDLKQNRGITADESIAENTQQTDWRRGNWDALSLSEDPLLRAVSDAVVSETTALDPAKPLSSGRKLLEQSIESRAMLNEILERFSSPTES